MSEIMKIQSSLPLAKKVSPQDQDQQLRDAAKMYEKHFLREMVKAMRSTVPQDGIVKPGMAEKIYKEQLDAETVEAWGDRGGIGFGEIIYQQIKERYFPETPNGPIGAPKGPLPLESENQLKMDPGRTMMQLQPSKGAQIQFDLKSKEFSGKPMDVLSPWSGTVLSQFKDKESGLNVVKIKHELGLESVLAFSGGAKSFSENPKVEAGEKLGSLDWDKAHLSWQIDMTKV